MLRVSAIHAFGSMARSTGLAAAYLRLVRPMRIACAVISIIAGISHAASNDHLVPRPKSFAEYRQFVRARLEITPFDCGRIVLVPDLGPEAAVSVYAAGNRYLVTRTAASGQGYWQARDTGERVKVLRIDREISSELALLIRHAIAALLSDVRRDPASRTIGGDIHLFEVSLQTSRGILRGDSPRQTAGPRTKALEELCVALIDYCEAPVTRRKRVEAKIRRLAIRISQKA